jgi:two-component system chemotaxis response regulator CheB
MSGGAGKIRIVMVDDSALARAVLKQLLEADGDIEVVAEAHDGLQAPSIIRDAKPDLVTMDIDMPGRGGLDTIAALMRSAPVPILVVTGEKLGAGSDLGFRAIERGALDYLPKPSLKDVEAGVTLRTVVRVLSKVPVFRHGDETLDDKPTVLPSAPPSGERADIIALASGAGGSKAVAAIISRLPADLPCTVAVAQQTPFPEGFARYLRGITPLPVRAVSTPHECVPGEILVVGAAGHLITPRRGVFVTSEPSYASQSWPSADELFGSLAEAYGRNVIGVVLSGIGRDGVVGLAQIRASGGMTIAESPETARPAELPRAAVAAGVVDRSLSAQLLADFLVAVVSPDSGSTVPPSSQRVPT